MIELMLSETGDDLLRMKTTMAQADGYKTSLLFFFLSLSVFLLWYGTEDAARWVGEERKEEKNSIS